MQYMKRLICIDNASSKEIFDLLYPAGNSAGNERTRKAALKRMMEIAKKLRFESHHLYALPELGYSGKYENGQYVLVWNYAHKWIALYKKDRELVALA